MYEAETIQQLQDIEKAIQASGEGSTQSFESIKNSISDLASRFGERWAAEDEQRQEDDQSSFYQSVQTKLNDISQTLKNIEEKLPTANRLYAAIIMAGCLSTEKDWAKMDSGKFNSDGDLNKMLDNVGRFIQKVNQH